MKYIFQSGLTFEISVEKNSIKNWNALLILPLFLRKVFGFNSFSTEINIQYAKQTSSSSFRSAKFIKIKKVQLRESWMKQPRRTLDVKKNLQKKLWYLSLHPLILISSFIAIFCHFQSTLKCTMQCTMHAFQKCRNVSK